MARDGRRLETMRAWPVMICAICLVLVGCDEKREKVAEYVSPDGVHAAAVYVGHYNATVRDTVFVYVEAVESGWRLFHSRKRVLLCESCPDLVSVKWTSADKLSVRFAVTGPVVRKETSADGVSIVFEEVATKEMSPPRAKEAALAR